MFPRHDCCFILYVYIYYWRAGWRHGRSFKFITLYTLTVMKGLYISQWKWKPFQILELPCTAVVVKMLIRQKQVLKQSVNLDYTAVNINVVPSSFHHLPPLIYIENVVRCWGTVRSHPIDGECYSIVVILRADMVAAWPAMLHPEQSCIRVVLLDRSRCSHMDTYRTVGFHIALC